ncbi:MAG: hypothetical protein ACE5FL_15675 [Myxococcota bacterium]
MLVVTGLLGAIGLSAQGDSRRPRIRDLGVSPGVLEPGQDNAITDVAGVLVGHATLIVQRDG